MSQKDLPQYLNPFVGPTQFRLDQKSAPWAGNYFPMQDGGLAQRWRVSNYPQKVLDKASVQTMSATELRNLSPVEKYDILLGYYDFRTTQHELKLRGPGREHPPQDWEGFCNGVRCAGIMTPEPAFSVTVKNPDGLPLEFSQADLKALAGASYFYVEKYGQIGGPTHDGMAEKQPNAAVFDLVLRYHLAYQKKGFVIDSHLGPEIWNETVVGYERKLGAVESLTPAEKKSYPLASKKVLIKVVLDTLGEIEIKEGDKPTKAKVADGSLLTKLKTSYTLYLNDAGEAIDGQWHNGKGTRGVDFAWFVGGKGADHEYSAKGGNANLQYDKIIELIEKSVHPECSQIF